MSLARGRRTTGRRRGTQNRHTNTRTVIDTLVTRFDGRELKVDYFNKQITIDETIVKFDLLDPTHLINFNRIKGLVIHVIDEIPIEVTDDSEIKGSGIINIDNIVPTIGDVFIITLDGNIDALMAVNKVHVKSYNNNNVFEVDYSLIKLLTNEGDEDELIAKLSIGVIEDNVYDDEHQVNNTTPIIGSDNLQLLHQVIVEHTELNAYFNNYLSDLDFGHPLGKNEHGYFLDLNIHDFIFKTVELKQSVTHHNVTRLEFEERRDTSILDVLLMGYDINRASPYNRVEPYYPISSGETSRLIMMSCYATNRLTKEAPPIITSEELTDRESDYMNGLMTFELSDVNESFPKLFGSTYIFSETFYNKKEIGYDRTTGFRIIDGVDSEGNPTRIDTGIINYNQVPLTKLERNVQIAIDGGKYEISEIISLAETCYTLTDIEKLYFIPIVLLLLNEIMIERADAF